MNWIILIGILAAFFEILGMYFIGNKNKLGFILLFICGILWIISGVFSNPINVGLLIVAPVIFCVNIRNFIKWKKNDKIK